MGSSKDGTIKSAPAFSMAGRQKPRISPTLFVPGPGSYDGEYQVVTKKSPMYSMGIKHKGPTDDHLKPGPGAHCPEKINLQHTPSYSFGIKHSPYLGQFRDYDAYEYNRIC